MQIHNQNFELYVSSATVKEHTARIASQINRDYANATTPPLIVITLGGAVIFAADLVRALDFVTEIAFVKCCSYNGTMCSSGEILFELPLTIPAQGRDVIVIEDIVDTGTTYVALHEYLTEQGATSVRIATMLLKRDVYKKALKIDYTAIEIDDIFVIGLGLDYNQLGRNLDGIYRLSK